MSMIGYLRHITPEQALKVEAKPTFIKQLLRGPYDMKAAIRDKLRGKESSRRAAIEAAYALSRQISDEIRQSDRRPGPISREEYERVMQPLRDAGAFGDEKNVLRLEKSWHTLHYLLTGSAEPGESILGKAILGGKEIGPDLGYGPARFLSPEEVRQVAKALATVSTNELARRFDLRAMEAASVYACRDEGELDLAQECLAPLKQFYAGAAAVGDVVLFYIE